METLLSMTLVISAAVAVLGSHEPLDRSDAPASHYLPQRRRLAAEGDYKQSTNRYVPGPRGDYSYYSYPRHESTSYGVPDFFERHDRHGYEQRENQWNEPAKYEFGYEVKDDHGSDYGQQESRDGSKVRGRYHVLLPDGRKQIVVYEADEAGYRPKITYEEPNRGYDDYNDDRRLVAQKTFTSSYPGAPYSY